MKRRSPVVCLAFSGGLDTTYCAVLLRQEGSRVHAVTGKAFADGERHATRP